MRDEAAGTGVPAAPSDSLRSDDADVLGFLALAPGSDVELDLLAFVERLVATALDVGEVDEHIIALLAGDEAEALLSVEELHGACCHLDFSSHSFDRTRLVRFAPQACPSSVAAPH